MEVADDWNFSERLTDGSKPIAVKTSWPHKEGKWGWGNKMDQVVVLLRNPRWAVLSYAFAIGITKFKLKCYKLIVYSFDVLPVSLSLSSEAS